MSEPLPRRSALKSLGIGGALVGFAAQQADGQDASASRSLPETDATVNWADTHDRVWLAGNCWANPMEDWRIREGAAECLTTGGDRNIHLITHQLTDPKGDFEMSVGVERLEKGKRSESAGFKIGVKSEINEHRSNVFAKSGVRIGVDGNTLMVGRKTLSIEGVDDIQAGPLDLRLTGRPDGDKYSLTLAVSEVGGNELGVLTHSVPIESVLGNIAVVSNFDPQIKKGAGSRYRFRDWTVSGKAFTVKSENAFGPILWSMYSLSDSRSDDGFVMKMSALTGPLGADDSKDIEMYVRRDEGWHSLGTAQLDTDAWTATLRVANWDASRDTPYLLVYRENHPSGAVTESVWTGTVKANPSGRPLRLGALTCQNDYAFPYEPVAENLVKLDPDMLYFSGDQLYEGHGGYGLIREPAEPAILNYLRKYYQFGWAFRHAMKDRPTLCIPDDHDVFQGNIWGEGGRPMDVDSGGASSNGGYREPARMVNVVHKTNCAHHPAFADPRAGRTGYQRLLWGHGLRGRQLCDPW